MSRRGRTVGRKPFTRGLMRFGDSATGRVRTVLPFLALSAVMGVLLVLWVAGASAKSAATNTLSLNVVSARTEARFHVGTTTGVLKGAPIPNYKFIINVDETGTTAQRSPEPGTGCAATDTGFATPSGPVDYPFSCLWPSITESSGWATIYAQGDQADLAAGINLDDGRYLISVIADGYKIDGAHFCVDSGTISDVRPLDDHHAADAAAGRDPARIGLRGQRSDQHGATTPASETWPASSATSSTRSVRSRPTSTATRSAPATTRTEDPDTHVIPAYGSLGRATCSRSDPGERG